MFFIEGNFMFQGIVNSVPGRGTHVSGRGTHVSGRGT